MTKLSTNPMQKQLFSTSKIVDNEAFSMEEIDWIANYCKTLEINKGQLFESNPDYSTRDAYTAWIEYPTHDTRWMYDRLNARIERFNDYVFNLDLTGLPYIQYAEYHTGGHHDFHMDMAFDYPQQYDYRINEFFRKLTVVILLTQPEVDFGGGEFQLNLSMERTPTTAPLTKGSMLLFPSFLLHKVCPVTWGIRKTLTTWVLGPKLR
jgi:PKHD-type hydroxylase